MESTHIQRYKTALEHLRKLSDLRLRKPLLIHTVTGNLRVLRPNDIGYFRYNSTQKSWEVALRDGSFVRLRGNLRAENLCSYSEAFVQIHQSYVINLHYLQIIQDRHCLLDAPFHSVEELQVSLKYKKKLLSRFHSF